jgi:hypothetical protein
VLRSRSPRFVSVFSGKLEKKNAADVVVQTGVLGFD